MEMGSAGSAPQIRQGLDAITSGRRLDADADRLGCHISCCSAGTGNQPGRRASVAPEDRRGTLVPDAHDRQRHLPMMTTADMAMKRTEYRKISERFHKNPASSPTPSPACSLTHRLGRARHSPPRTSSAAGAPADRCVMSCRSRPAVHRAAGNRPARPDRGSDRRGGRMVRHRLPRRRIGGMSRQARRKLERCRRPSMRAARRFRWPTDAGRLRDRAGGEAAGRGERTAGPHDECRSRPTPFEPLEPEADGFPISEASPFRR